MRLGFGEIVADEFGHVLPAPADAGEHALDLIDHARADFGRVVLQLEVGVGIDARQAQPLLQPGEELGAEFLRGRRAEADRVGRAFAHRDPVVRPVRRQVEHVPGFEEQLLGGLEVLQDAQRGALDQAAVGLVGDLPAPPSRPLQQEDIIVVEVRADAPAIDRVADHEVVEPGLGDEVEAVQQRVGCRQVQVEALHQHGPRAALAAQAGALLRAVLDLPVGAGGVGRVADPARLDVGIAGEFEECVVVEQAGEAGDGLAHEEGFLLPVFGEEALR